MTDDQLIKYRTLREDIKDGVLAVGSKVEIVIGNHGDYDPFDDYYGKLGTLQAIGSFFDLDNDEEEVFQVEMPDGKVLSTFFSEISYERRKPNPITSHLRRLTNVE